MGGRIEKTVRLTGAFFLAPLAALVAASAAAAAPEELYGGAIEFTVLRDGREVGEHRVTFSRDAQGDLLARSSTRIAFRLLGIIPARFVHDSRARWRNGDLLELSAETRWPHKSSQVRAAREDGRYVVGGQSADPPLFPTTHWNIAALAGDRLLNTLTGEINSVQVLAVGEETVDTNLGPRRAARREVSGDLNIELWHDPQGRWLRMDFLDGGALYSFRCRVCVPQQNDT